MNNTLLRRCIAEALGTFFLVIMGCGAIIARSDPMSQGLAFGLGLLIGIYTLGPVSGAHFNPAVTLGFSLVKKFPFRDVIPYWIAQFIGAIVAIAVLIILVPIQGEGVSYGANIPNIPSLAVFGFEIVLTFIFVMINIAFIPNAKAPYAPFNGIAIGLALGAIGIAFGNFGVGSLNPARSLGPALFAGIGTLKYTWIYTFGPLIGTSVAALVYKFVRPD